MNNEIKEILDNIKDIVNGYIKACNYKESDIIYDEVNFSVKQWKQLLDYITNLQTIEQQYSAILSENAELENKITNLQEENEKLKRLANKDYTELNIVEMQQTIYKSRIDKAIEILHNINDTLPLDLILNEIEHSEYVLHGSDKE